jgi:hypothetical protein
VAGVVAKLYVIAEQSAGFVIRNAQSRREQRRAQLRQPFANKRDRFSGRFEQAVRLGFEVQMDQTARLPPRAHQPFANARQVPHDSLPRIFRAADPGLV